MLATMTTRSKNYSEAPSNPAPDPVPTEAPDSLRATVRERIKQMRGEQSTLSVTITLVLNSTCVALSVHERIFRVRHDPSTRRRHAVRRRTAAASTTISEIPRHHPGW